MIVLESPKGESCESSHRSRVNRVVKLKVYLHITHPIKSEFVAEVPNVSQHQTRPGISNLFYLSSANLMTGVRFSYLSFYVLCRFISVNFFLRYMLIFMLNIQFSII
jgi:hypothetical protein